MLEIVLHWLIAGLMPPLMLGVINKVKAAFAGRQGPPLLQPYYDLAKLWRKGSVFSSATSWVFRAGPVVLLAATVLALALLPLGASSAPIAFVGDVLLFAYLLALGRFFLAAAALDTASAFEGMGAAREVTFACLAEPALFFGLLVLARLSGALSLSEMLARPAASQGSMAAAALVLVGVGWFILLLAENARVPFDDPNTHLELTMIHEVMILDHSGPLLGLILYASGLKLFLFAALLVRLAVPLPGVAWADWTVLLAGVFVVAALVGVVESVMARLRLVHVGNLLVAACVLPAFGIVLLVI